MSEASSLKKIYKLIIWKRSEEKQDYEEDENEGVEVVSIQSETKYEKNSKRLTICLKKAENPLPGNPIVVFGHGNGEKLDEYLGYSENFCPHGISICAIDYRGYGYSDGEFGSSSVTEREDMISVINYLQKAGHQKISYFGRSLGATCGIFVAAHFPDLVCLAFDSPWLSTKEWTEYKAKFFDHIDHDKFEQLLPKVYKQILDKTGIDFNTVQEPREVASKITQPLFVIHGSKDVLVPDSNSKELIDIVQSKEKVFKTFNDGHNGFKRYPLFGEMFNFILKHNGVEIKEKV